MGILRITKDALTRANYEGLQHHLVPRGVALPIDIFGSGQIRFGKKAEAILPLFVPDNRYKLQQEAIYFMDRVTLNRVPEWINVGGYVYINERELHEVADVVGPELILGSRLLADQAAGQPVYHYSNPVKVEGNYSAGKDVLVIDLDGNTDLFLVRGDRIAISSRRDITLAFKEYTITDYSLISTDTNGVKQYQVSLDRGIHRSLDDEELIQLRAFMAYKSKILPLPVTSSHVYYVSGPLLLDWKSIPFLTRVRVSETQYIQKYDTARSPIGPPLPASKNLILIERPIQADQFLFWDKVDGDMNYDKGIDRFLALTDDSGHFWMKHTCVPPIQIPSTFASGYIVTTDATLLTDNEYFIIDDGETKYRFEYQTSNTYVPTPTAPATGNITISPGSVGLILNNDWFSLNDGFGTETFFEYKKDASTFTATPNYRVIDITSAAFDADVSVATEAAINAVTALKIDADRTGLVVDLQNQRVSEYGNQPIGISANLLGIGWTATGMSGGTYALETIDIRSTTTPLTSLQVALLTSAAINRAEIRVRTDFAGVFNSFRLHTDIPGTAGNIPILRGITNPTYLIQGMSGGSGGVKWNCEVKSVAQDALMRVRFFPNDWLPNINLTADAPQIVTLELKSTDQPVERIDVLFKTENTGEIQIGTWNISTPTVAHLSHEYVTQMVGDHTYAANGLWIKPLFSTLRDVETKLGVTSVLNTGRLRV